MKYTDWKVFIPVMLFLSQTHNDFLSLMGSETFRKISPLSSKSARKALDLWINEQSNGKITCFETEGQCWVQAKWKQDKHQMATGEPQEKLTVAMTTELLIPLDDYILKTWWSYA